MSGATIDELARLVGARVSGPASRLSVEGLAAIDDASDRDITLYVDRRLRDLLGRTAAIAVVVDDALLDDVVAAGRVAIVHPDPWDAVARISDEIHPPRAPEPLALDGASGAWLAESASIGPGVGLSPGCVVHGRTLIGPGTLLGPAAVVGPLCSIGSRCRLGAHSWIGPGSRLGDDVELGPGAVVGSDGFGLRKVSGALVPIRHLGIVIVGDGASIGARSVVARGTLGATRIGPGARIDAQVQIGHNVTIGAHCAISAQVGIAGSCTIGDGVLIGGQAGIADHLRIGDGARIAAQSGVVGDVEPGATVAGYPAVDRWKWLRMSASCARATAAPDDHSGFVHEKE